MLNFSFKKSSAQNSTGKVISVLNQKGGVGKTTMTFNVARALAERGHKVLCIDMDPQANLSLLFGVDSNELDFHIYHLLINSLKDLKPLHTPVIVDEVIVTKKFQKVSIDILPAGQELSGFELSVAGVVAPRQLILKKLIEKSSLKSQYDFILIDGPPTLGLVVVNILCATDGLLVPFQPDQFSQKGLSHFHNVLGDIEEMGITTSPKILGYIPNLVDNRRKQTVGDFDLIRQDLQGKVFAEFGNRVQLVKSSSQKKSVFDYQAKDYRPLQEQFLSMAQHIEQELV
ncbi:MAG: ParA family protein [Bacteriovoracaceae bacterium]|nr:ParA family protein [Bacteriovoracaceae bacterium]